MRKDCRICRLTSGLEWMPVGGFCLHFNVPGPAPLRPSVDMAHKLSRGRIDSVADFSRVHFPTLRNGLLSWQRQQSTTVDPADMREFIRSGD